MVKQAGICDHETTETNQMNYYDQILTLERSKSKEIAIKSKKRPHRYALILV